MGETGKEKEIETCSSDMAKHVQNSEGHAVRVEEFNYVLSPIQRLLPI